MVDLDYQQVRGWILNLLAELLTLTWLILPLRQWAVSSQIYWPNCWPWHGWYGLSESVCSPLESSTDWITDPDMVDLESQEVRSCLSKLSTTLMAPKWLILTLRLCVIASPTYSSNCWLWHGWFELSGSARFRLKYANWIADPAWLTWVLRESVICSQIHSLNCWPKHD